VWGEQRLPASRKCRRPDDSSASESPSALRRFSTVEASEYTYELCDGDDIISTGRLRLDEQVLLGTVIWVNGVPAEIVAVIPRPDSHHLLLRRRPGRPPGTSPSTP